jgi:hypothetical protein
MTTPKFPLLSLLPPFKKKKKKKKERDRETEREGGREQQTEIWIVFSLLDS